MDKDKRVAEMVVKIVAKKPEVKKQEAKKPEVKKAKDYYTLGEWKGYTQYKCSICPFDSLDEESIISHINDRHIVKPPRPVKEVQLFDRYGREIIKKNK